MIDKFRIEKQPENRLTNMNNNYYPLQLHVLEYKKTVKYNLLA